VCVCVRVCVCVCVCVLYIFTDLNMDPALADRVHVQVLVQYVTQLTAFIAVPREQGLQDAAPKPHFFGSHERARVD